LRDPTDDFFFVKLVSNDYGLYQDNPNGSRLRGETGNGGHTAQHLAREDENPAATPVM